MKNILFAAALTATTLLASCTGMTGQQSALGGQTGTGLQAGQTGLGQALGKFLGDYIAQNIELSNKAIAGTWTYQGSCCVYESENWLKKAGSELAATAVQNKLDGYFQKLGVKKGSSKFTFKEDGTFTAQLGSYPIEGSYKLDNKKKTMLLQSTTGLLNMTAHVSYTGKNLSLLFDSSKLLSLTQGLGKVLGSKLGAASSLLGNYDGMMLGMTLSK